MMNITLPLSLVPPLRHHLLPLPLPQLSPLEVEEVVVTGHLPQHLQSAFLAQLVEVGVL